MSRELLEFDQTFRMKGNSTLAGVDEAGRGPLAGPVVIAAVILPAEFYDHRINDSKKLSAKMRLKMDDIIRKNCADFSLVVMSPGEIDRLNIRQATLRGMRNAVQQLNLRPDLVLVDGENVSGLPLPQQKIIKGDSKSISIAAASIIAKVFRDNLMEHYHFEFPQYAFDQHKGYGTEGHRNALIKYGPSPIHRQSFLGNLEKWKP